MATKKENLPLTLDQENDSTGTITYANEVIAIIAGVAANEVEGVAGMCSGGGITEVIDQNKEKLLEDISFDLPNPELTDITIDNTGVVHQIQ